MTAKKSTHEANGMTRAPSDDTWAIYDASGKLVSYGWHSRHEATGRARAIGGHARLIKAYQSFVVIRETPTANTSEMTDPDPITRAWEATEEARELANARAADLGEIPGLGTYTDDWRAEAGDY